MNFAYCICPTAATSPQGDIHDLAMRVLSRKDKIILDQYNLLMECYSKKLSPKNADSFRIFEMLMLKHKDKIIESTFIPSQDFNFEEDINPDTLVAITSKAKTVNSKCILCQDDKSYSHLEDDVFEKRISIITTEDELYSDFPDLRVHISPHRLSEHLSNSIRKLCDRDMFKTASEDECNDQIRDMMGCHGYLIKDQTRRGVSARGYSAGEVDLVIDCGLQPYAIIEGLILDSVNKTSITSHITKALTKYDNVGLCDFFILVYYRGADFARFTVKYYECISKLTSILGNEKSPVEIHELILSKSRYTGYNEITCLGKRRDREIKCTHMLIDQG